MPSASAKVSAPPAGILRRLGALCYDLLLLIAVWMATLFVGVLANQGEAISAWWVPALLYAEAAAYFAYSWLQSGQTLGMRTWHLKVVDAGGGPITWQAASIRLLVAPLSMLAGGLGYAAYYWSPSQQTWHDQLSDTYVVQLPKPS